MRINLPKVYLFLFLLLNLYSCEKEISTSSPTTPIPIASIIIESNPEGAKIYEDGKFSGKYTPDSLNWLEERTYKFTLKKEFYRDTSFYLDIKKEDRKEIFIDYLQNPKMYGKISFLTEPDSVNIFLDGDSTGFVTPDTIHNIIPGEHHIVYKRQNCITDSINVMVTSNQLIVAFLTLIDTTYWIEYSSQNSNIPSDQLLSIAVDKNGVIWIGSLGGLFTFDGREWIIYDKNNSPLLTNFISNIAIDSENCKWIGTNKGLYSYDGNIWKVFTNNPKELPSDDITDILITDDNEVFVATPAGLLKKEGFQWRILLNEPINSVCLDYFNNIWVTVPFTGILQHRRNYWYWYFNSQSSYKFNNYKCVTKCGQTLWFGHFQDPLVPEAEWGLSCIDISNEGVYRKEHKSYFDKISVNKIRIINNEKWLCTDGGLYIFKNYPQIKRYWSENTPMKRFNISDVAFDKNGNAWVATMSAGLYKFKSPD